MSSLNDAVVNCVFVFNVLLHLLPPIPPVVIIAMVDIAKDTIYGHAVILRQLYKRVDMHGTISFVG